MVKNPAEFGFPGIIELLTYLWTATQRVRVLNAVTESVAFYKLKKKTIKCKRTQQFLLENVWEAKRCIMGDAQMVNAEPGIAAALLTCYLGRMYFGMK